MKPNSWRTKLCCIAYVGLALAVFAGSVRAQEQKSEHSRYTVTDLGTLPGGTFSQATFVNDSGLITGLSTVADGTQHAVLWNKGSMTDIAKHAPAGTNSGAFGVNERGQVLVQAETTTKDPNNENFCAYGTGLTCRAFLWQNGVMTLLPTLGGNNSTFGLINNRGEVAGIAETGVRDPKCPSEPAVTGSGPQALDFEAVVWGPRPGEIRALRPLPDGSVAMAFGINDLGQVVGGSGSCADTILPGPAVAPHAVLWENGTVTDMGNLGGTVNTDVPGIGTIALAINNRGQAVGAAALLATQPVMPSCGPKGCDICGISARFQGTLRALAWTLTTKARSLAHPSIQTGIQGHSFSRMAR